MATGFNTGSGSRSSAGSGDNGGLRVLIVSADDRTMKDRLDGNDYVGMIGTLLSSMLCHVPYVTLLELFVVVLLYVML